ncbi:MAG: tetratricopeptide repeat protein [Verrucomicrobia bacterium]|nr:tetratricopeptide repeat protein [Verrucomicrobiota bacterium]
MLLSPNVHILITSRVRGWETEVHLTDEEYRLTQQEGLDILKKYIEKRYEENEAKKIVNRFQNYPVLIAQAGYYISKAEIIALKDYLPIFEAKKIEILKIGQTPNQRIDFTTALELMIGQFKEPLSLPLLRCCAYLPGKNIPTSLLQEILDLSLDQINKPLAELRTLLVQSEGKVTMHEVFQDIIGEKYSSQSAELFTSIANRAVISTNYDEFFLTDPDKSLSIFKEGLREAERNNSDNITVFCDKLGKLYFRIEKYQDALKVYEKGLNANKKLLGNKHSHTASSYNKIGDTLITLSRYKEALYYLKKALEIRLKSYGEYHADTGESYDTLGGAYLEVGLYKEALENIQKGLEIRRKVHGEINAATAESYGNIGTYYWVQKQYKEALVHYEKTLDIQRKVMGENHPKTAIAYNNVGAALRKIGRLREAMDNVQKGLEIHKKIYGERHSATAINHSNVGSTYEAEGQFEKALKSYKTALEIQKEVWGEEHYDTARSYKKIGRILQKLGYDQESLENHRKAVAIMEKIRGENHPDNKEYYKAISKVLKKLGEQKEAHEYEQKAYANSASN